MPDSCNDSLKNLRQMVLDFALKMSRSGMAPATWGNVSAIDREKGIVAITPSGMAYESLTWQDICLVDLQGNSIDKKWKPSTETPLHLVFYKNRPDIGAVVHTHSIYATAFACCREEIPVFIATLASGVGGRVPVAAYQSSGTQEFGQAALEAMRDRTAVLLANHGVVAVGKDLNDAYTVAELVENAAKIAVLAFTIGEPVELPEEEVSRLRWKYLTKYGQKG